MYKVRNFMKLYLLDSGVSFLVRMLLHFLQTSHAYKAIALHTTTHFVTSSRWLPVSLMMTSHQHQLPNLNMSRRKRRPQQIANQKRNQPLVSYF